MAPVDTVARTAGLSVQPVVMAGSATMSWTVVNEGFEPLEPAEAYFAHLTALGRSPNTARA